MKLPDHISGPTFEDGDWVSFLFEDAEIAFRIPKVPYDVGLTNSIAPVKDFRNSDTCTWQTSAENRPFYEIVDQSWRYEDQVTHDDVAKCYLSIAVSENKPSDIVSNLSLDFKRFKADLIRLASNIESDVDELAEPISSKENDFFSRNVPQKEIDWLVQHLYLQPGKYASPIVFIPINSRFIIFAWFYFGSLHYPDRQNPYSDELLHQMKLDLFDEFLSYIQVEYSGRTLETIRKLNPR